jgi:hypothetical protein
MTHSTTQNSWDAESIYAKALLYVEKMESCNPEDWEYGLWSALCLELLARAALANISPVLLAESKDWMNLMYALKKPIASPSPKSIAITDVFNRLKSLIAPEFTQEDYNFCVVHIERRNAELHAGETIFTKDKASEWLPKFYKVCKVLLESTGKSLNDFVADSNHALELIDSLNDSAAKSVKQEINAHTTVWNSKPTAEKEDHLSHATAWAIPRSGHVVKCPSCISPALLQGKPFGEVKTEIEDDMVIQRQAMLPSSFECIACGLKISGFSKLSHCSLGNTFSHRKTYSPAEFFDLYTEDDLDEARRESDYHHDNFEDFFNE